MVLHAPTNPFYTHYSLADAIPSMRANRLLTPSPPLQSCWHLFVLLWPTPGRASSVLASALNAVTADVLAAESCNDYVCHIICSPILPLSDQLQSHLSWRLHPPSKTRIVAHTDPRAFHTGQGEECVAESLSSLAESQRVWQSLSVAWQSLRGCGKVSEGVAESLSSLAESQRVWQSLRGCGRVSEGMAESQ